MVNIEIVRDIIGASLFIAQIIQNKQLVFE